MAKHVYAAQSWEQARRILENLRPDLPISFGTGNPVCRPYVRAVHLDADAGEGLGYRVAIKPLGDGYGNPAEYFLIYIAATPSYSYKHGRISQMVVSEACSNYLPHDKQISLKILPLPHPRQLTLAAS